MTVKVCRGEMACILAKIRAGAKKRDYNLEKLNRAMRFSMPERTVCISEIR